MTENEKRVTLRRHARFRNHNTTHNKTMYETTNKLPYLHLYCSDWQTDARLQLCSLAARGLWIELLFLMHDGENYGHLQMNGEAMPTALIAKLVRSTNEEVELLIQELEQAKVFSRDEDGVIYSRRLLRDLNKRQTNQRNGKRGGNPFLKRRENATQRDANATDFDANATQCDSDLDANATEHAQENDAQVIDIQEKHSSRLTGKRIRSVNRKRDNDNDNDIDNDIEVKNKHAFSFDSFWTLYDKKVDRIKCKQKFDRLTANERNQIEIHLPKYIQATTDKKFRKNPLTYLAGQCWQDEIIQHTTQQQHEHATSNKQKDRTLSVDAWVNFATR